jgi:hypothetical protein
MRQGSAGPACQAGQAPMPGGWSVIFSGSMPCLDCTKKVVVDAERDVQSAGAASQPDAGLVSAVKIGSAGDQQAVALCQRPQEPAEIRAVE